MNLDIFKTPKKLPFVHYIPVEKTYPLDSGWPTAGEKYTSVSLQFGHMPIMEQPSINDLWAIENNSNIQKASQSEYGRMFAGNILLTSIARKSRRAAGNILIVPNDEGKAWFYRAYKSNNYNVTVIVDPSLEPNELRATYWKIIYSQGR